MAARWNRRRLAIAVVLTGLIGLLYYQSNDNAAPVPSQWSKGQAPIDAGKASAPAAAPNVPTIDLDDGKFHWASVKLLNPVPPGTMRELPRAGPVTLKGIPKIQHTFGAEPAAAKAVRLARLEQVRSNFTHAWTGYKTYAWMADELKPVQGAAASHFGGWSATLVDTLDTLWIMGFRDEFEAAVAAIDKIDFSRTDVEEVNVFETTIRYLGGFLAAYDLTEGRYPSLLLKATELGDMLYLAFDTPNRVPVTRWRMAERRKGKDSAQVPHKTSLVSELGSLSLEFTRLSQLTGNDKYFDAVQRIMDMFAEQQDSTHLPGMWPVIMDAERGDFTGSTGFTIGGMADSLYEYLPKEYLLLGGAVPSYRAMYLKALDAMSSHIFFRPRTNSARPILFAGDKNTNGRVPLAEIKIVPKVQHLGCFAGGMVGLASRAFGRPEDMELAQQLVEGCLWAYESAPAGVMPEIFTVSMCPAGTTDACAWSEQAWLEDVGAKHRIKTVDAAGQPSLDGVRALVQRNRLSPGVLKYEDKRYILRPEAIESVFILYRLTGDRTLMDRAWGMFESIVSTTQTPIAHTAVHDCTNPRDSWADSMESFWLAETLKYFYLIFEEPDVVSLDTYVLNTEAHPLRRPSLG